MNPTVELLEVFFALLLGIALGISGTSVGEAWRDRRAVKKLAPENERAMRNVKKALRNELMRIATYAVFVAATLRALFLPPEDYPEGQQYFQIMFVLLIVGLVVETALDRKQRVWEMQPIYAETETDQATAEALAATVRIQEALEEIKGQVTTMNEGTVGSFAADDETRRVRDIDRAKRTPTEQRHLDAAPAKEAPQGPPR